MSPHCNVVPSASGTAKPHRRRRMAPAAANGRCAFISDLGGRQCSMLHAPWFDQTGGGSQVYTGEVTIEDLLRHGYIREVQP